MTQRYNLTKMNKGIITTLILAIAFTACQAPSANEIPEDLAAKRTLLSQKRKELRELNSFIASLDSAIVAQDPTANAEKAVLITTAKVEKQEFNRFVEIQGSVQADDFIDVSAETSGRITHLAVKEGQYVKRGQLIAKLDLETLKKQIAEIEISRDLAQTTHDRQKRLWDQNIGSEMQYLQAKNNLDRLNKNLELMQLQLSKGNVYAPQSGEVEKVVLQAGEIASPGIPIVMMLNTHKLKVVAEIPETYLGKIKKGQILTVNFPAINQTRDLKVTLIGNVINPANRTFTVEMAMSKPGNLKPNLLANVKVNDLSIKDALVLPIDNIQQEVGGKSFIYTVNNDRAQKTYVSTGESADGKVVITEGLNGGETLILKGAQTVKDGSLVEISPKN